MPRSIIPVLLASWLLLMPVERAIAQQRMALVIGNGAYAGAVLKNPKRDAEALTELLRQSGFEVSLLIDASRQQMIDALRELYLRGRTATIRFVFFAGHGVQAGGRNFLLPVDVRLSESVEVERDAIDAAQAVAQFSELRQGVNIFVLDACRESPLPSVGRRRAVPGLAQLPAPRGTFVAFSTHPGGTAQDSPELPHSVYTFYLLRHLRVSGQTIEDAFKSVRSDVVRASDGRQVPWDSSSLVGEVCLVPGQHGACGQRAR
jgi:uncharacterized caspase-like protein